jgi:hypothetical protein
MYVHEAVELASKGVGIEEAPELRTWRVLAARSADKDQYGGPEAAIGEAPLSRLLSGLYEGVCRCQTDCLLFLRPFFPLLTFTKSVV